MRFKYLLTAAALVATLLAPLAQRVPLAQTTVTPAVGTARVIVKYKADSALLRSTIQSATTPQAARAQATRAQALGSRIGIALAAGADISDRSHVVTASGMTSAALAARLSAESDIEYAVPDERKHRTSAPNDSFYASRAYNSASAPTSGGPPSGQWYLKPPGVAGTAANTGVSSINAEQAWDLTTGNSGIVVAVLDTGVRFDHPDFTTVANGGNLLPGYDMVSDIGIANDGDGRDADASDPGDWVTAEEAASTTGPFKGCTVENSSWHGTQTLGLIGATTNNGVGIASVGRNVRVSPVRVLGKCGGDDSDILAAINWAAGIAVPGVPNNPNPARVISMSLGGKSACSQAYQDTIAAVNALGVVVVASAGNDGNVVSSPANCPGVLAVTALRQAGDKVGFSNLGSAVAISAPGGNCVNTTASSPCLYPIITTVNAGATTPIAANAAYTDSFNFSLGTSFSAPLVAGTVALMLSVRPELTAAEVKSRMQSSAAAFPTSGGSSGTLACTAPTSATTGGECYCTTSACGAGMLDARAAVAASIAGVLARVTPVTTAPTALQAVTFTSTNSITPPGHKVVKWLWALVDGGGIVTAFTSATNAATVIATPSAAGSFTVSLTTTDDLGLVSSTNSTVTVAAAPVTVAPPGPPATSSGGGALGGTWLALLALAVLALALDGRAPRRR